MNIMQFTPHFLTPALLLPVPLEASGLHSLSAAHTLYTNVIYHIYSTLG